MCEDTFIFRLMVSLSEEGQNLEVTPIYRGTIPCHRHDLKEVQ